MSQTETPPVEGRADTEPAAPVAASITEIKAACPGADNDFICEQLGVEATVAQAQAAWMKAQTERLKAADTELAKLKAAQPAEQVAEGVEPAGGHGGRTGKADEADYGGDPIAEFNGRVTAKVTGGMDRRTAVIRVAKADRALHKAYVKATNSGRRAVQERIDERFEDE